MLVLLVTVGTGVGGEERTKSLAHGLTVSIRHYRPDRIVFFGSKQSILTVEMVEKIMEEQKAEMPKYQFIELKDIDNINECFETICKAIEENKEQEIVIDYTSGTKTMSVAAVMAGILYKKKLSLIAGKRKNGIVVKGTEEIRSPNVYTIYDKMQIEKIEELCNIYQFKEAERVLEKETVELEKEKKEFYSKVIRGLEAWDKFNHEKAMKYLKEIKAERMNEIKKSLGIIIVNPESIVGKKYLLIDILNNAERRIEEGKYDDAVGRLYRCVELIEQIRLAEKYGIDTGNVEIEKITKIKEFPEDLKEYLEGQKRLLGKVKIGLTRGYQLLKELGDELGKEFFEDTNWKELVEKRNSSILAHGFKAIEKEVAVKFKEKVKKIIIKFFGEEWKEKLEKTKFPKIRMGELQ